LIERVLNVLETAQSAAPPTCGEDEDAIWIALGFAGGRADREGWTPERFMEAASRVAEMMVEGRTRGGDAN
jgi:hypothetical protein